MVGGLDYEKSRVNLAVGTEGGGSGRQPGSSFKPIILAEAIKQGTPLDKVYDAPAKKIFPDANAGDDWEVGNYADAGLGRSNLIDATRKSSNTAYAQMILRRRRRQRGRAGQAHGDQCRGRPTIPRSCSARRRCRCSTWPAPTRRSPTTVSTWTRRRGAGRPTPKGTVLYEAPNERERGARARKSPQASTGRSTRSSRTARARAPSSASPLQARRARPTSIATPGSPATRARSRAAVWMGYPGTETSAFMNSVHGVQVTGGTFPATIWRKFMTEATKDLRIVSVRQAGAGARDDRHLRAGVRRRARHGTTVAAARRPRRRRRRTSHRPSPAPTATAAVEHHHRATAVAARRRAPP